MPSEPEGVYLDTSVLIAYIRDEPRRGDTVEHVLTAAADGKLAVRTSTLSIVEVSYGVWDVAAHAPAPQAEKAIESLWHPSSAIKLIEASISVMRTARDMARRAKALGFTVKPADAVHMASAVALPDTGRIFVYERQKERWAELTGLEVTEPFVIEPPLPLE